MLTKKPVKPMTGRGGKFAKRLQIWVSIPHTDTQHAPEPPGCTGGIDDKAWPTELLACSEQGKIVPLAASLGLGAFAPCSSLHFKHCASQQLCCRCSCRLIDRLAPPDSLGGTSRGVLQPPLPSSHSGLHLARLAVQNTFSHSRLACALQIGVGRLLLEMGADEVCGGVRSPVQLSGRRRKQRERKGG